MIDFTQNVVALARHIRSTGDFSLLPILADALEEPGIEDEAWLRHCRESQRPCDCQLIDGVKSRYVFSGPESHWEPCEKCIPRTSSWVVSAILAAVGDPGEHPLRGVCEEPGCDGPRLAYAKLIEPRDAERCEFIKLQCTIASIEADCGCGRCSKGGQHHNGPCAVDRHRIELPDGRSKQAFLRRRERELLVTHQLRWAEGLPLPPHMRTSEAWVFRRGFPAEITCTWQDWQQHHAEWWWSPLQTVECDRCLGAGNHLPASAAGRFGTRFVERANSPCSTCHGSGRVPRPFPTGERECGCHRDASRGGRIRYVSVGPDSHWERCDTCHSTGRVPGEPSVMPLEVVRLATEPNEPTYLTLNDAGRREWLAEMWPGLRFETPQEATVN